MAIIETTDPTLTYTECLERQIATLERLSRTQSELIEMYKQDREDTEIAIKVQRAAIDALEAELATYEAAAEK